MAAVCIASCEKFLFLHSLSDSKSDGGFFIYVITCTCGRKRKVHAKNLRVLQREVLKETEQHFMELPLDGVKAEMNAHGCSLYPRPACAQYCLCCSCPSAEMKPLKRNKNCLPN